MTAPTLLSHTHWQFAHGNHTSQNLPKSMAALRTVVNRNCLLQEVKMHGIQHGLRKHRGSVAVESSELLDSPPIQNFDNEKSN
jgi:hypothetical protein